MNRLQSDLHHIAEQFLSSVISAVTASSVQELFEHARQPGRPSRAETRAGASGEPPRRGKMEDQKNLILRAATALPPGFRKSDVMKKAESHVNLSRALALLVEEGTLRREGQRNLARYTLA